MKKIHNTKLPSIFMVLGIVLIILSVTMVVFSEISEKKSIEKTHSIVGELKTLMPKSTNCAPDYRTNTVMPILEIKNTDFIGIIEIPAFNTALPIHSEWSTSEISQYPCRYMGSVYDDTLIIGGNDSKGQFDFIKTISNGDTVTVTDVTGMRFTFSVTDIRKTKDVSTENLTSKDNDLVLFARNAFAFDYTVIRCDFKTGI